MKKHVKISIILISILTVICAVFSIYNSNEITLAETEPIDFQYNVLYNLTNPITLPLPQIIGAARRFAADGSYPFATINKTDTEYSFSVNSIDVSDFTNDTQYIRFNENHNGTGDHLKVSFSNRTSPFNWEFYYADTQTTINLGPNPEIGLLTIEFYHLNQSNPNYENYWYNVQDWLFLFITETSPTQSQDYLLGYAAGYDDGYDIGYTEGYEMGINQSIIEDNVGGIISAIFSGLFGQIFAVEIFPGFPLYIFILIPTVFAVIGLLLWLIRGK